MPAGRPRISLTTGTQDRILAGVRCGESVRQISEAIGDVISQRTVDRRVREIVQEIAHQFLLVRPDEAHSGLPQVSGVYFVQCADRIKIGWSSNIASRLSDDTFCPYPLILLAWIPGAPVVQEREIHRIFSELRTHREWFRAESPLTDFILGTRNGA